MFKKNETQYDFNPRVHTVLKGTDRRAGSLFHRHQKSFLLSCMVAINKLIGLFIPAVRHKRSLDFPNAFTFSLV